MSGRPGALHLVRKSWPGNVRELSNAVRQLAAALLAGRSIDSVPAFAHSGLAHSGLAHSGLAHAELAPAEASPPPAALYARQMRARRIGLS